MKFLAILALTVPAATTIAVPDPVAVASPDNLQKRTTCVRKLRFWPGKKGVCVDMSLSSPQCTGGEVYKADCGELGSTWYCCIV